MTNKNIFGQSIVEMIFSIAFLALFLTGSAVLLTNALGAKTKGADRKKAAAMGEQVIESLVEKQKNDKAGFWDNNYLSNGITDGLLNQYPGYSYSVAFANRTGAGCNGVGETICVDATISVGWSGSDNLVTFSRFFSKVE